MLRETKVKFITSPNAVLERPDESKPFGEKLALIKCRTGTKDKSPAALTGQVRRKIRQHNPSCSPTRLRARARPPRTQGSRAGRRTEWPRLGRAGLSALGRASARAAVSSLENGQCDKDTMCPSVTRGSKPRPPAGSVTLLLLLTQGSRCQPSPENVAGGNGGLPRRQQSTLLPPIEGHFLS